MTNWNYSYMPFLGRGQAFFDGIDQNLKLEALYELIITQHRSKMEPVPDESSLPVAVPIDLERFGRLHR